MNRILASFLRWLLSRIESTSDPILVDRTLCLRVLAGDGAPLLAALLSGCFLWGPGDKMRTSLGGLITVENNTYFYVYIDGRPLHTLGLSLLMQNRIECAAVNSSCVGNALHDDLILARYQESN